MRKRKFSSGGGEFAYSLHQREGTEGGPERERKKKKQNLPFEKGGKKKRKKRTTGYFLQYNLREKMERNSQGGKREKEKEVAPPFLQKRKREGRKRDILYQKKNGKKNSNPEKEEKRKRGPSIMIKKGKRDASCDRTLAQRSWGSDERGGEKKGEKDVPSRIFIL